jgi:ABC-type lipoprotein export system ATPase subunit
VLRDLSLDVSEGEMVAVVGASGVGKSTLLHVLGGLDRADSGVVEVGGRLLADLNDSGLVAFRNQRVGSCSSSTTCCPSSPPRRTSRCRCASARCRSARRGRGPSSCSRAWGWRSAWSIVPSMLSGGEQQRVAVARALVMRPSLLLADEPTGDLDEPTAESLHALLRQMHAEHGLTSVIATHNPKLAAACDRVLRLEGGQLRPA